MKAPVLMSFAHDLFDLFSTIQINDIFSKKLT